MTEKLKRLSESWIFKLYNALIGTLIFLVLTFGGYTFNRAMDQLDITIALSRQNKNTNIAMCKDIHTNEIRSKDNTETCQKNKEDITAIKYRIKI